MILILYSLFGFQVIVIQRQCLSVDYRERPTAMPGNDATAPEWASNRAGLDSVWSMRQLI